MSLTEQLKKPPVLIAGAGIGLVILLLASSRGNAGNNQPDATFSAIAAQQNTSIASTNATYNAKIAELQSQNYAVTMGNDLSTRLRTLDFVQNLIKISTDGAIQDRAIQAGVTNNIIKTNADITIDRMNNELRRFLGPIDASTAVSIAQITSNAQLEAARIGAANQQTLAQIYANRSTGFGSSGNTINDLGVAASGAGNLVKAFTALFAL